MPKITTGNTGKYLDILKQKKLEQKQLLKKREVAVQTAKELKFDAFVQKTAKEMLDLPKKYRLEVFDEDETKSSKIPCCSFVMSIWAPWSKFLRK